MATIRKRGNSYQIRVSEGYDSKGNQVIRTKTWKPNAGMTQRQIENELNKQAVLFEEQCLRGIVSGNVKFEEFAERWMSEYARVNLKNTSYQKLKNMTMRIYPAFGHLKVDKITHGQIQVFIDDLSKNGRNMKNGQPLSRKTVIHHLNFLSDVFTYAVRMEMRENNPCANIVVPKGTKKEKDIYTVEEMQELFRYINQYAPTKYKAFMTLAVYGGFRNAELMGLEWKDIDWDDKIVSIVRTSNYTVTDGCYTDTPKTESSVRSLKLPDNVFDVLYQLREEQLERKTQLGNKWVDSDRLFITGIGKPLHKGSPYKWHKEFTERYGLKFCDIHSLRHFNATVLINAGVDVATISRSLGHSSISTTTNIYCHSFKKAQAKAGLAVAAALNLSPTATN